jgi:hypothetical protein
MALTVSFWGSGCSVWISDTREKKTRLSTNFSYQLPTGMQGSVGTQLFFPFLLCDRNSRQLFREWNEKTLPNVREHHKNSWNEKTLLLHKQDLPPVQRCHFSLFDLLSLSIMNLHPHVTWNLLWFCIDRTTIFIPLKCLYILCSRPRRPAGRLGINTFIIYSSFY